ncbi:MAG: galactose mutarotase [Bacteroidales bacterium]|nr:galactose mutarotase [Bacteroidales bacterium]
MEINKSSFGHINNKEVYLFTLTNKHGMIVRITNYGGIVTSIIVPDKKGNFDDMVLGYDNLDGYLEETPYFGAIVGRYANRVAKGKLTVDGEEYTLATNNGPNHLHGGIIGFDKVIWDADTFQDEDNLGLELHYISKDGEEGYPGNLDVTVVYILTNYNELKIDYKATTDKATPVNLSHHSYFSLAGTVDRDVLEQVLWIDADKYTVVDETLIPTGELRDVTPSMDFRSPKKVGNHLTEVEGGYDHNYVLNNDGKYALVATLTDSSSGRIMEVYTSEPGIQFYSGNFLDGTIKGKNDIVYKKHYGLCLETQHFPDSPNQPGFPNTILRVGETYTQQTVYKFGLTK